MKKWSPLITICMGTFMLLVDVTIVNVALPDIAVDLNSSFTSLQWVVDAYALTLAALLLGIGAFADLTGHRRSYVVGLALFAAASAACGFAPNPGFLIGARVVQGLGGATMFATTFALLNTSYQGKDRGVAYGMWGAVASASAAVGPILGGLLVQAIDWRWIFFVNLPVSVLAIVLCLRVLPHDGPRREGRVDLPGTVAFSVSAGALTYGLIRESEHGWASIGTWGMLVLSAVALAAFVAIQRRSSHALLDLDLFRSPAFGGTLIAALLLNFAAFASFTYTSIWLQSVIRLTPIETGLTGLPLAAVSFVAAAVSGKALHGKAPGPIIATGLFFIGLGGVITALMIGDGSSWPALLPGFAVMGLGVGVAMPTLSSSAMASVPPSKGGMAAGAVNTFRQLGYAVGIAVLGSAFASSAAGSLNDRGTVDAESTSHALASGQAQRLIGEAGPARQAVDAALRLASTDALQTVFWIAGLVGIVAAVVTVVLVRTPAAPPAAPARGNAAPDPAEVTAG